METEYSERIKKRRVGLRARTLLQRSAVPQRDGGDERGARAAVVRRARALGRDAGLAGRGRCCSSAAAPCTELPIRY